MTEDNDHPKPEGEIEFIPTDAPGPNEPLEGHDSKGAGDRKGRPEKESPSEGPRSLKEKIKKKDAEIKHLKKEMDGLKDQFLRKLADIENLRKRFEREKEEYYQFALSDLFLELLSIKDNLERALRSPAPEADGKTFREGVELIDRMFQALLSKNGVQPVEIADRRFDPNFHHAMATEESEGIEEPEVVEELQKGYVHHHRLLRPALVKVAVPKKG